MIISSYPQNPIASSTSLDPNPLRFGVKPHVKKARVKNKKATAIPKTVDTTNFRVQKKKKPQVTERKLWSGLELYKSGENIDFADPDVAERHSKKQVQQRSKIDKDFKLSLEKGTQAEKQSVADNFWRIVDANPWEILKSTRSGSLNFKELKRQASRFTYKSSSVSRESSPRPSASKNVEASQQESSIVASHRSNRSSPAPMNPFQQPNEPALPIEELGRRGSKASSPLSLSNLGFRDNDFTGIGMPASPGPLIPNSMSRQSPFHSASDSHGELADTFFEEQFNLMQGNIPAPASHKSFNFSDIFQIPAKTRSEKSVKSVTQPRQRQSKTATQMESRKKLEQVVGIIGSTEDDGRRNKAIRALKPVFTKAVGVRNLDYSQESIFKGLLDRAINREKIDVDKYIIPAQMDPDEIGSFSSENTAAVVNSQTRKGREQRATSTHSDLNAAALSVIDTVSQSQNPTLTWVRTLSTKATSPSPFEGDNASSVFALPNKSLPTLPRAANPRNDDLQSVSSKSTCLSALMRDLSEPPASPKNDDIQSVRSKSTRLSALIRDLSEPPASPKKDDLQSVSSKSTSLSGILRQLSDSSVRSKSPGYRSTISGKLPTVASLPTKRKRVFADIDSTSGSNFEDSSSAKSVSVSSDNDFSDYESDLPRPEKSKPPRSGVTGRTVKRVKRSLSSLSKQPKWVISRPKISTNVSIPKEELASKIQNWINSPGKDQREKKAQQLLNAYPTISKRIINNTKKPLSYDDLFKNGGQLPVTLIQFKSILGQYNKHVGYKYGHPVGNKFQNDGLYSLVGPFCANNTVATDAAKDVLFEQFKTTYQEQFPEEVEAIPYSGFLTALRKYEEEKGEKLGAGAKRAESKPEILRFVQAEGKKCKTPGGAYKLYKRLHPEGLASQSTFYRTLIKDPKSGKLRPRTDEEMTYSQ